MSEPYKARSSLAKQKQQEMDNLENDPTSGMDDKVFEELKSWVVSFNDLIPEPEYKERIRDELGITKLLEDGEKKEKKKWWKIF